MKNPLNANDLAFLLGDTLEAFNATFAPPTGWRKLFKHRFKVPKQWQDYYLDKVETLDITKTDALLLVKYFLQERHLLSQTFFSSELPRDIRQSVQILLKAWGLNPQFSYNNKALVKTFVQSGFVHDITTEPYFIRLKLNTLDKILRDSYGLKLFFLLNKQVMLPYQFDVGVVHFFLKPLETQYFADNTRYTIGDISLINDDAHYEALITRGLLFQASVTLDEVASAIDSGQYKPAPHTFVLGDGIIQLFYILHPQFPLIHWGHTQWDNVKVLFFEAKAGQVWHTERVAYAWSFGQQFKKNLAFYNVGHICTPQQIEDYGFHLIVKYSTEKMPIMTEGHAECLLVSYLAATRLGYVPDTLPEPHLFHIEDIT